MRYIAAYLLLQTGGNASPSAADITKLLGAVGIDADEDRLSKLLSELEGKDVASVRSTLLPFNPVTAHPKSSIPTRFPFVT